MYIPTFISKLNISFKNKPFLSSLKHIQDNLLWSEMIAEKSMQCIKAASLLYKTPK